MSIPLIQKILQQEGLNGWLLYDFQGINKVFYRILDLPEDLHVTRKVYYWIPVSGAPLKFVHKIEIHILDKLPGELKLYARREELEALLQTISGKVAMETSKEIPYVSFVDAGTINYLSSFNQMEIVSSATLIQKLLSVLNSDGIASHLKAAKILDQIVGEAFQLIKKELPFEKEVSDFIVKRFQEEGCITNHAPIVARGPNSANPHYTPVGKGDKFQRGDFILIDLWCKLNTKDAIYADITRVGCLGEPTRKMKETFNAVREAQNIGVAHIKEGVRGADVDTAARTHLEKMGYSDYVLHRLGHSIDTDLHGRGANLDSFESFDTRKLLLNTCYSIEPALYFPYEFGLRLEFDILLTKDGVQITGGTQDEIYQL